MTRRGTVFKSVEVGRPFVCNGTQYLKVSSRTGKHQNGRTFYFAQAEVVTAMDKEGEKA